jgi:O-6-methylguanine DNA methyltransferase
MNYSTTYLSLTEFKEHMKGHPSEYSYMQTPTGTLKLAYTQSGIYEASFVNYIDNTKESPTKLLLVGTLFQVQVWKAVLSIPLGSTVTYQDIACAVGRPKAWRAVANAVGQNKIAYLIPCHRVIRKNGELSGYKWDLAIKKALLHSEQKQKELDF